MLSREVVILARIVHAQCCQDDDDLIDAGGHRASTDAIWALESRGLIADVAGVGRGVRAKWAISDWKNSEGEEGRHADQDVVDRICFMIEQHLWAKGGKVEIRAGNRSAPIWKEAVEYLSNLGVMRITNRFLDIATPRDLYFLKRWNVVDGDHYEFDAIDAEFVDRFSFQRRRYPEVDWNKRQSE